MDKPAPHREAPQEGTSIGHFLRLNPVFSAERMRHKIRDGSNTPIECEVHRAGVRSGILNVYVYRDRTLDVGEHLP